MAPRPITEAELYEALAASLPAEPAEARTVKELADASGIHFLRVRRAILALQQEGKVQLHKVTRVAIDGRHSKIAAYTFAGP